MGEFIGAVPLTKTMTLPGSGRRIVYPAHWPEGQIPVGKRHCGIPSTMTLNSGRRVEKYAIGTRVSEVGTSPRA
jgi:hypothetical protein